MARLIETLMIPGPAGRLEALLEEPDTPPVIVSLVCHPHPQHGGTMHNKVVYRLARGLRREGSVVLRFNYRGVNLSEGQYDKGVGEVEDARACLALLRERYPALPFQVAGFSFGSRIALKLGCAMQPQQIIAVGFPTVYSDRAFLESCTQPRVFIQSTNDEFGPGPDLLAMYEPLPEPKSLHWVPSKDHFFVDALDDFERVVQSVAIPALAG
ncbi:MAG: alpha/beta hydrolase [Bryobacteraceae bacterium]|nr:alpha/beta hydrolase [Bryobacteraceae bacterium]